MSSARKKGAWGPEKKLRFSVNYGFDLYRDSITSKLWNLYLPPVNILSPSSRGQYISGSRYLREPAAERVVALGTDGFGRSDTRAALRQFFGVDAQAVAKAARFALGL